RQRIDVVAWGPGADRAIETVAPGLAGALDDPRRFVPRDELMEGIWRDHRSVLLTRTDPFPVLIAAILEQKVQGVEARRAWRAVVMATADPAPGDIGLHLPPDPERLGTIPSWLLSKHRGVHRRAGRPPRAGPTPP